MPTDMTTVISVRKSGMWADGGCSMRRRKSQYIAMIAGKASRIGGKSSSAMGSDGSAVAWSYPIKVSVQQAAKTSMYQPPAAARAECFNGRGAV